MSDKPMIGITVFEMTSGGLQKIIDLPTTSPLWEKEKQQEAVDAIIKLAYENEKMYLSMEDRGFMVQGLKNKTIVVEGIFEE